jgi:uncharacterized protein YdhG (YjbR/CyaY superfamily)
MTSEVDNYIAALPAAQAAALKDLRDMLRRLLPEATEQMSYAMPGFRQGKMVAGYAAFARQCGFYPHFGSVIPGFAAELDRLGFRHTKSGVNFTPDQPLPPDLVARIVAARLDEIAAGY